MPPTDDDRRKKPLEPQSPERRVPIFNRILVFVAFAMLATSGSHSIYTRSLELKGHRGHGTPILITGAGAVAIGIAKTGLGILFLAYALFPTHRLWNYSRKDRGRSDDKKV